MADHFIDSANGSNAYSGHDFDNAWLTYEYGVESGALVPDDIIWLRRNVDETPVSDILFVYDGSIGSPIRSIGCPRPAIPNTTITQADFTNGSALVDNVVGITPARRQHIGRYITAPDGEQYVITAVLWEFTVDGMGAGAEFAVGEVLTNTTQTKKGKVWAFTDNLDTTGTIQAVVDSSSAWVTNDNITSDGGGDAELSADATAVGFLIEKEYAGTTVTGVNGKFQIEADEDYTLFQAIDDTLLTIKKADWNADAINLPRIDFNDGAFQAVLSLDYYNDFYNMEFKDSTEYSGILSVGTNGTCYMTGCLFKQSLINDALATFSTTSTVLKRCIFEGYGVGSSQIVVMQSSKVFIKDSAFYNLYNGLQVRYGSVQLENVNLGIEMANAGSDIAMRSVGGLPSFGRDVNLGGTNGYVDMSGTYVGPYELTIENYGKVLGAHKSFYHGGTWERAAVTGETPNKKVSDNVIKISPNKNYPYEDDAAQIIFTDEFEVTAVQKSYKYWLYNDTGDILNNGDAKGSIWLELEYVGVYDDNTEYIIKREYSTEVTIADAFDADDWDYLQITNITPATASKLRIICRCKHYTASGDIFIDEAVVIS